MHPKDDYIHVEIGIIGNNDTIWYKFLLTSSTLSPKTCTTIINPTPFRRVAPQIAVCPCMLSCWVVNRDGCARTTAVQLCPRMLGCLRVLQAAVKASRENKDLGVGILGRVALIKFLDWVLDKSANIRWPLSLGMGLLGGVKLERELGAWAAGLKKNIKALPNSP